MRGFGSLSLIQLVIFVTLLMLAAIAGMGSYQINLKSNVLKRSIEARPEKWCEHDVIDAKNRSERADWTANLLLNLSAGMLGSAVTFLLISYIFEHKQRTYYVRLSEEIERKRLIRQMASPDNALALQAVNELRVNGALVGGGLVGADLTKANLVGADLKGALLREVAMPGANLQGAALDGADLTEANLKGAMLDNATAISCVFRNTNCYCTSLRQAVLSWADFQNAQFLTDLQLREASMLWGTIMPDGIRYDGRFDLRGDREEAVRWAVHYTDPVARATFFGAAPQDSKMPHIHDRGGRQRGNKR